MQEQDLSNKQQQLKELEEQEKELTKSLPLTTQISLLEREIKVLASKSTRTKVEEKILESKKKELAELLKKQGSSTGKADKGDKTVLYLGLGITGILLILGVLIWIRTRKRPEV